MQINLGIAGSGNLLNNMGFIVTGAITVTPTINTATPIATSVATLVLTNVNTGINYEGATNLTVNNVTGTTDFKGQTNGALILTAGGSLAAVTSSQAAAGTLVTAASGKITGPISNVNEVQVNGIAGTTAEFQQDISATKLTINNGGTADLKGSLTTTNDVQFNGTGGILQFSGIDPDGYSFNSAVTNGQNGTLNVYTNLTSTDASIGEIKTINIGQLGTANALNVLLTNKH